MRLLSRRCSPVASKGNVPGPDELGMAIEETPSADLLKEEQKRDIFYNHAVRFLRLDEEVINEST